MRNLVMIVVSVLSLLFAVCSAQAFIYYVEAEDFDQATSEPVKGGGAWDIVENKDAFNEKQITYTGPHTGANTSLFYPISNVSDSTAPWTIWILCVMPDTGSDSYFFYVSTDGGNNWGPQQTAGGSGVGPDWRWEKWVLNTPLQKGGGNVLRIAERESAQADLICIRNDGLVPSEEEYEKWLKDAASLQEAVDPRRKIATTWGDAKSVY